jgi:hypothetical protein
VQTPLKCSHPAQIEAVIAGMSKKLGGDHTQDLARLLRLPGFPNVKDARSGAEPTACRVVSCDRDRTYAFDELAEYAGIDLAAIETPQRRGKTRRAAADSPAINRIVSRLNDTRVGERSEVDFGVLSDLLRLGLTAERAWDLVKGKSKFATDGRRYFDTSWANAVKQVEATTGSPTGCPLLEPGDPLHSARKFVDQSYHRRGAQLLWHHAGDFYVWTGSHYVICEDQQVRAELYMFLENAVVLGEEGVEPFKPTKSKVDNVFDALQALTQVPHGRRPPTWLTLSPDKPDPRQLLPCRNGLLHLQTMRLLAADSTFFCTHALDVDHDEAAQQLPIEWLRFLTTLWPNDQPSIDALQDWFGYVLLPDTRQHKMLLLVGPPRSGKGTIGRVLTGLLGAGNVAAPTLAGLQTNFGLAPLIGKPLAIISDARLSGRADQQAIVERLLSISGEDFITIDRKYRAAWTGCLPTRFMIMTNELPRLGDSSGALANRFIVLTLERSFLGNEDIHLTDKLLTEMPQILHWSIVG